MTPSKQPDLPGIRVIIIGVAGGSGSGKTTFVRLLEAGLLAQGDASACAILSQDRYYIDQSARFHGDGEDVNFDHPQALDFALLARHLGDLKQGLAVEVPVYDYVTHKRKPVTERFAAVPVIILDGTLILSQPEIVALVDVAVFIDTPEAVRLDRRIRRDMAERGRTREGVLKQFTRQVKPMHDEFVEPSKATADFLISGTEPFEKRMPEWIGKFKETKALETPR